MTKRLFLAAAVVVASGMARAAMEAATPESQGVSSRGISSWIRASERTFDGGSKIGAMHGFVIVRHGKVIAEGNWKPFDSLTRPHMLYSHSKSFTSTAIGFLVDEGKLDLDVRVIDIFPESAPSEPSENLKALRVRDLLTMNVGASFADAPRKDLSGDWVKLFLANTFDTPPGTRFRYDSSATYMLSAIVERKSGQKLMDFLKARLFDRIGIEKAWSTVSPAGIACGGWGMNMTTRELARFGQFCLQRGTWEGEQLLSSEWVDLATARQTWSGDIKVQAETIASGHDWKQGYGFQFWRCRHGAYRADGASGQFTIVLPEKDAVVSIQAGVRDMQKELQLVWDYLLPAMKDGVLPEDAEASCALARQCAALSYPALSGARQGGGDFLATTIDLEPNKRGIKSVSVEQTAAGWVCTLVTPAGVNRIPVGYGEWASGTIRIDTEPYEGLGTYSGEFVTRASGAYREDGSLQMRIYLPTTPGWFDINVNGKVSNPVCSGEFSAMNGCTFKSRGLPR